MHKEVPEFVTYLYSLMENYKPPIDKDERDAYIQQIKQNYAQSANQKKEELMKIDPSNPMMERILSDAIEDIFFSYTQQQI